jgi:acetoin utilization deacetylase AcuC-like enzyme
MVVPVGVFYSARYHIDIGRHVFPTRKYSLVYARLVESRAIVAAETVEPAPASWDDLALVHTSEYLSRMREGALTAEDVAELELPWSSEIVLAFRLMVGGTVEAARRVTGRPEGLHYTGRPDQTSSHADHASRGADLQVRSTVAVHLGGGLHHAFPNHGEGFCPFNDVAVAIRVLQREGIERAAVIDLDVHHGNGTAFIFESDPRVFTFSMHQQHNYPMWKPRSTLDIGLTDGTRDATYLGGLERALPKVMASAPECVFYLAGADPYQDDQLGGLRLTKAGLRQRDRMVVEAVRSANVPLVVVLAGGYARDVEETVAIHAGTVEEALKV